MKSHCALNIFSLCKAMLAINSCQAYTTVDLFDSNEDMVEKK